MDKDFVIISRDGTSTNGAPALWSTTRGWTSLAEASRFPAATAQGLDLTQIGRDAAWLCLPADADEPYIVKAALFQEQIASCVEAMQENGAQGQVVVFLREQSVQLPQVVEAAAVDLSRLHQYDLIVFTRAHQSDGCWKQVFHPASLTAQYIDESPTRRPQAQVIEVSLDGGQTFQPAPAGVRVIYRDVPIDGEEARGEVHINATPEGLITDVWTSQDEQSDHHLGTESMMIDDLVCRLVSNDD